MTSPGEVQSLTARGGVSMGGIYSKEDTSFLIMCSSFLFPINIWVIFIGSQLSSVIPHMVLQHRLSQALALTVCTQSAEKPFFWKAVRSYPQYFIKLSKESLTHKEMTEKRNITLNKVVQQVWKKNKQKLSSLYKIFQNPVSVHHVLY